MWLRPGVEHLGWCDTQATLHSHKPTPTPAHLQLKKYRLTRKAPINKWTKLGEFGGIKKQKEEKIALKGAPKPPPPLKFSGEDNGSPGGRAMVEMRVEEHETDKGEKAEKVCV